MSTLDRVIDALYESISYEEGAKPQVERLAQLFEPGARLVHAEVGDVERMSVDDFADKHHERAGTSVAWFREHEVARKQERFGCIAQVFSTFEARLQVRGETEPRTIRGINSLQLRLTADRWLITSLLWTTEGPDQRLS